MHLRARFHSVSIRVLHPGIHERHSVEILRGLPEGSRLSPTLFGIFVADLITSLQKKFPRATASWRGSSVWTGGILYVDDLCLISADPKELQEMIHECQRWSERARMQLNASKSKVMAFNENSRQRKARHHPRKVNGTNRYPAPFHIASAFPSCTPDGFMCTPLEEVQTFDYLGLRLDRDLNMKAAVEHIIEKANEGHALVSAVCYSLRYDKHHSNPTQSQQCGHILQLWKSCVLPHYLLYLRYLCTDDQLHQLQVSLNQSLSSTLRVGGHTNALLADTGVPPLQITQRLQLAQMRYRVSHSPTGSLPLFWWRVWNESGINLTENLLHGRMLRAVGHIDRDRIDPHAPMPPSVRNAKPESREKSYKHFLKLQCSTLWRQQLEAPIPWGAPGRMRTFAHLFLSDKRKNLYKPTWFMTQQGGAGQLDLLRLRAQAWTDHIPTHKHYGHTERRREYHERYCPHCPSTPLFDGSSTAPLGDEEHILFDCPDTRDVMREWSPKFDRMTRLLDLPVFHSMPRRTQISVAMGEPPPKLLHKQIAEWKKRALPISVEFVRSLRNQLIAVQRTPGDMTSDDEGASSSEDEMILLEPPSGFSFARSAPTRNQLEPLNTEGKALVGSQIMYKWPREGWCQGELVQWNDNPRCKNKNKTVNFLAHYPCDNSNPRHALTLGWYNTEALADAHCHSWMLLEPLPQAAGGAATQGT